jgi:nucleoside-diphosphate-sugar epimerase
LSKLLGEVTAEQYCRWDPSLKVVSLRFSNVMEVKDYETRFRTKTFQEDEVARRWNAFGYIVGV